MIQGHLIGRHPRLQALEQVAFQDYPGPLEVVVIDDSPGGGMAQELEDARCEGLSGRGVKFHVVSYG